MENDVLIVEDDEGTLECLMEITKIELAVRVVGCRTGEKALDLLRCQKWGLMLLDLVLPGISGEEVLLIAGREGVLPPTMVMTASPSRSQKLCGVEILNKPFELETLIEKIKTLASQHERQHPQDQGRLHH